MKTIASARSLMAVCKKHGLSEDDPITKELMDEAAALDIATNDPGPSSGDAIFRLNADGTISVDRVS
jgi:hypothetical protein